MDARPRPRIVEFIKTITPPAYSGLPETTLAEDHGDISALDGSTVRFSMKANQPVSESAATLLPDAEKLAVQTPEDGTLRVTIPVNGRADSWQFALKANFELARTNPSDAQARLDRALQAPDTASFIAALG